MSKGPLVSVVIPCFNASRTIVATLESLEAQTWPEIEVIAVDDGSSDATHSILTARTVKARAITVLAQPNRGQTVALNAGMRLATGDWFQFLDADDLLHPEKIRLQVNALRDRPHSLAASRWARFYGEAPGTVALEGADRDDWMPASDWLKREWHDGGGMLFPARWLVSRSLAQSIGPWNESLTVNNDGEFFTRALKRADGVTDTAGAIAFYRSGNPGSLSGRRTPEGLASYFRSLQLITEELDDLLRGDQRLRDCLGCMWMRFAYGSYPYVPDLVERAEATSKSLTSKGLPFDGGQTIRVVSRLFGWRAARRLQRLAGRA